MVFNGEGCATIVLLYTYTESVEKKIMMKKGRRKENEEKKCSPKTWLDLNSAPLGWGSTNAGMDWNGMDWNGLLEWPKKLQ